MRIVRILSIDGGGIRAIVPAMVLSHIERQTGKRICELFDVVAGTSTGGLIALALTKPNGQNSLIPQYSASDLVRFFEEHARSIYPQNGFMDGWLRPKYDRKGMDKVLEELLGDFKLKQSLANVAVTGYDTDAKLPVVFKSWLAKNLDAYDLAAKDVARATCSAPTYFEPVSLTKNEQYKSMVDGSIFASNPSLAAYCEASAAFSNEPCDYLLVSLGTGRVSRGLPYDSIRNWGQFHWMKEIVSIYSEGIIEAVDQQMHNVLPITADGRQRYFRIQKTIVDENIGTMDNASDKNMAGLKTFAQEMLNDDLMRDTLDRLMYQLHILSTAGSKKQLPKTRTSSTFTKLQALSTTAATSDAVPVLPERPVIAMVSEAHGADSHGLDSHGLDSRGLDLHGSDSRSSDSRSSGSRGTDTISSSSLTAVSSLASKDGEMTVPPASISSGEAHLPLRGLNLVYSPPSSGPEFLSKAFLVFCEENKESSAEALLQALNHIKFATIYNDMPIYKDNLCWLVDRARGMADCIIFVVTPEFVRQFLDSRITEWINNLLATSSTPIYFVFHDMKDILGTNGAGSSLNKSSPVHLYYNSSFDLQEGAESVANSLYKQELKRKA